MRFLKVIQIPDVVGNKFVQFMQLKNKHLLIFVPLFALSWWLYSAYFMDLFDFTWRFVPTFILGFLTCYLTYSMLEIKNKKKK